MPLSFIFASSLMEVIDLLCFDKGANQYFIASDEQVKIVENQMNDILKRMISEGKELITLSEIMDALGVDANQKDGNDQKERSDCKMPTVYELVRLDEDKYGDNSGYPVETHLGYYSSIEKAEAAWERYKKQYPEHITDVSIPYRDRVGHDIYEIVANDRDEF